MVMDRPKLLFKADTERRPYLRRFAWMVLGMITALAAYIAIGEAAARNIQDQPFLDLERWDRVVNLALEAGWWVALILVVLLFYRAVVNLWRGLTTRNESIRVFDQGFAWKRGDNQYKYSWAQLKGFREGGHTITIFGRPLLQWGGHTLIMRDGKRFTVTARHGNLRRFAKVVEPYVADRMGTIMGQALRQSKSVRLHPDLTLTPQGIVAGDHKIPWSQVDVQVKNNRIAIRRLGKNGKFRTVKRFNKSQIDNVAGFLDIAHTTIQNHQPERFNIQTQGVLYQ